MSNTRINFMILCYKNGKKYHNTINHFILYDNIVYNNIFFPNWNKYRAIKHTFQKNN